MSTQRGNTSRSRPQKHKNRTAFKNSLHDTSGRTKLINSLQVADVCARCKDIIEWKIKYKKYKPLTQPRKCVKCEQRTVRKAYHVMCTECGKRLGVCTKCCEGKEVQWAPPENHQEPLRLDREMRLLLKTLPERRRRTFMRYMDKKNEEEVTEENTRQDQRDDLLEKLRSLKVDEEDDDDDDLDLDDGPELSDSDEGSDGDADGE